ncbi:MAG: helix-turn-helix domain-containing protein [Planctomycetaceae bacterium]|nr:helix-turn-helix domain-containing protein [Planctomycetaceae bacterium]
MQSYFTPPQLAKRWGVSPEKIYTFIRSGELPAINLASRRGGRPRYSIDSAEVAAFERSRQVVTNPTRGAPRRKGTPVKNYF